MAVDPNVEPGQDPARSLRPPSFAGLGAAAGFLLTSLPLGLFWFVVLAAPILLGVFLSAVWVVVGLILALVWRGGGARGRKVASGEDTPELQSRPDLLCPPLFVKKKICAPFSPLPDSRLL